MDLKHTPNNNHTKHLMDDSKLYCDEIKRFLQTYKTQLCKVTSNHNETTCLGSHNNLEVRRNPYSTHTFSYFHMKQEIIDKEKRSIKGLCQNQIQVIFHPVNYKVQQCNNYYNCKLGFFCPFIHSQDKHHFQYGEFFRFDIETFKSKPCKRRDNHERKVCIYYHNEADRRRQSTNAYSHVLCSKTTICDDSCPYSHNKIEQLYHPSRYKSKFCLSYTNKNQICKYRDFCSFAHTQGQITIRMIHLETHQPDFYIYLYKTIWCPFIFNHDKAQCEYAHNLQDYRRDPAQYKYKPQKCLNWNFQSDQIMSLQQAGCKNGMKCDKCHGWMEKKFHPLIYKKKNKRNQQSQIILKKVTLAQYPIKGGYLKGAPFFKYNHSPQMQMSQGSRRTNYKTINISSDRSNQGSDNKDDYHKSEKYVQNTPYVFPSCEEESSLWRYFDHIDDNTNKEIRAKSLGKSDDPDISYSTSVKDMLEETNILPKLRVKRINEVKIINLKDQQIAEFKFLTAKERQILSQKIKQYALKRSPCPINYSNALTRFFVKRKNQQILQKMKNKKVKQSKLLNLMPHQIKQLSFLLPNEKQTLPNILKQFSNNQQFQDISKLIKENTENNQSM